MFGRVYFVRVDICRRTSTEISSTPYQNIVVKDMNLCSTCFGHQILITLHYATNTHEHSSCCIANRSHFCI